MFLTLLNSLISIHLCLALSLLMHIGLIYIMEEVSIKNVDIHYIILRSQDGKRVSSSQLPQMNPRESFEIARLMPFTH